MKYTHLNDRTIKVETDKGFYVGSFLHTDKWVLDLSRTQLTLLTAENLEVLARKAKALNFAPDGVHLRVEFSDMENGRHPIDFVNSYGIRYKKAIPMMMGHQFWYLERS